MSKPAIPHLLALRALGHRHILYLVIALLVMSFNLAGQPVLSQSGCTIYDDWGQCVVQESADGTCAYYDSGLSPDPDFDPNESAYIFFSASTLYLKGTFPLYTDSTCQTEHSYNWSSAHGYILTSSRQTAWSTCEAINEQQVTSVGRPADNNNVFRCEAGTVEWRPNRPNEKLGGIYPAADEAAALARCRELLSSEVNLVHSHAPQNWMCFIVWGETFS